MKSTAYGQSWVRDSSSMVSKNRDGNNNNGPLSAFDTRKMDMALTFHNNMKSQDTAPSL